MTHRCYTPLARKSSCTSTANAPKASLRCGRKSRHQEVGHRSITIRRRTKHFTSLKAGSRFSWMGNGMNSGRAELLSCRAALFTRSRMLAISRLACCSPTCHQASRNSSLAAPRNLESLMARHVTDHRDRRRARNSFCAVGQPYLKTPTKSQSVSAALFKCCSLRFISGASERDLFSSQPQTKGAPKRCERRSDEGNSCETETKPREQRI